MVPRCYDRRKPKAYRVPILPTSFWFNSAILKSTILHHLSQQEQHGTVNTLKDSLYVDVLTTGADTVTEAFELYQSSKSIMASGGFNLRKWTTNSSELCKLIEVIELGTQVTTNAIDRDVSQGITEDDQSYTKSPVGSFATNTEDLAKILGVSWDTQSDMLQFDFKELNSCFYVTTNEAFNPEAFCQSV